MNVRARSRSGQNLTTWLIRPAQGWRHKARDMVRSRTSLLLATIGGVFFTGLSINIWILLGHADPATATLIQSLILGIGLVVTLSLLLLIYRNLFTPLFHLRHWAQRVRGGNLAARIPMPDSGEFAEMAEDVNSLTEQLQRLTREMRDQVRAHTERLEQKSRTLEILYDVAASINTSRNLEDLLTRFLVCMKHTLGARAATARLVTPDGQMRLVANLGFDPDDRHCHQVLPLGQCLCGRVADGGDLDGKSDARRCGRLEADVLPPDEHPAMIAVPLRHQGRTLGVYSLFLNECPEQLSEDMENLLTSIGRHLGMAIEKARLDEEAQRLGIIEERTHIAHELHDSLAQTLASLRFRVDALEESMNRADPATLRHEVGVVQENLQRANRELRDLIRHFRGSPAGHQGLASGVEQLVARFREETRINVYLQKEWGDRKLPDEMETEVLRIVQEALCNVRKHADAQHVRVLLRMDTQGAGLVMVEDDGCGIQPHTCSSDGDHIGLSVMRERAARLGADFRIESESGEGTRMTLSFHHPDDSTAEVQPRMRAIT